MTKRLLSLLLSLCLLCLAAAPAALAAEAETEEGEEERVLHIGSVDALRQLAADCSLDTYSDGLTVILDRDIDLTDMTFSPIPVFNGLFNGNNHTIRGLSPATDGSNLGLFRYLREDAVVRDLNVTGSIEPTVGRENLGGIAGTSDGQLIHCSFNGSVTGLNYVGGLVGRNNGSIVNCQANGSVNGKRFTGGVAGHSSGLIQGCTNRAEVNTVINEAVLDLETLSNATTAPLALLSAEDENVVSDSGGIVGYSSGVVVSCLNRGEIGYQHYGYNVGGIAGRQAGFLSRCENYGAVLGRKDVAGIVGQMEPYLLLTDSMNLADELILLNQYMNAASGDLANLSAQMQDALETMDGASLDPSLNLGGSIGHEGEYMPESSGSAARGSIGHEGEYMPESSGSITDAYSGAIEDNTGLSRGDLDDIRERLDDSNINLDSEDSSLSTAFANMADDLNTMYGIMSENAGYLADDLTLANNQFSRVLLLMSDALAGNPNRDIFADVSDELDEEDPEGRVSLNENYGSVEADSNVGGVIGAMGIEYEFDLEDTLVETVGANGIVNNNYDAKCVSASNVNRGSVLSKKDRVGGVVGSSEMGAVLACQSYGSVESSEGDYVGGVVGYSETSVRGSYAMCHIHGDQYVGGIVGYGNEITDCVSMIEADPATACLGAIAGWADMSAEGAVEGDVFVHESLGAVDGISYTGRAMPISYSALLEREDLPREFKSITLRFYAEDTPVATLNVPYGGSIDPSEIPAVPAKTGYNGAWSDFVTENVQFNAVINAVYTPYQSALASEETREDSPMALILLEGEFEDNVDLRIEPYTDESAVSQSNVLESWQLRLENLAEGEDASYNLRYQAPKPANRAHTVEIQQLVDGTWRRVNASSNGSYLSFPARGDTVIFRAVEVSRVEPKVIVLAAAAGFSLLGLLVIAVAVNNAKKKELEAAKQAAKAEEETATSRSGPADA